MKARLKQGQLLITIPLEAPVASQSGKTLLVASSRGVKRTAVTVGKKSVYLVFNAFVYPDKDATPTATTRPAHSRTGKRKAAK